MIRPTLLVLLLTPALAIAGNSISKVNGSVSADAGEQYDKLSTVNGSVQIERGATVRTADTVNGGISIGDEAVVGEAETVNGKIGLGIGSRVERDATTVNGGIRLEQGSEVSGRVETVNGTIRMEQATVGGGIETVSGSIIIGADSIVRGGITVNKPRGSWFRDWSTQSPPRVEIGANAVVEGDLRFDREVELVVHPSAKIGRITGDASAGLTVERP